MEESQVKEVIKFYGIIILYVFILCSTIAKQEQVNPENEVMQYLQGGEISDIQTNNPIN